MIDTPIAKLTAYSLLNENGSNRLFLLSRTPENIFNAEGLNYVCFGWFTHEFQRQAEGWFFSSPYNIGNFHYGSKEWFKLYSSTIGRFVYENYGNYFAPYFEELGIEHAFVDFGEKYPALVQKHTPNNGHYHKGVHYPLRAMNHYLFIPPNCDYEDFLKMSVAYIYTGVGGGFSEMTNIFRTNEDVTNPETMLRLFNPTSAVIIADVIKRASAAYNGGGDYVFQNAVKRMVEYFGWTTKPVQLATDKIILSLNKDYTKIVPAQLSWSSSPYHNSKNSSRN